MTDLNLTFNNSITLPFLERFEKHVGKERRDSLDLEVEELEDAGSSSSTSNEETLKLVERNWSRNEIGGFIEKRGRLIVIPNHTQGEL